MPKKVHGRPAPKSKPRNRSTGARPVAAPSQPAATQDELIPTAGAALTGVTSQAPVPGRVAPSARGASAAVPSRRAANVRRLPTLAINYDYLRGDIRTLAMLAPAMIVLLVIAFFVFR